MANALEGAGFTFDDAVKAAQDEIGLATDTEPEATQTSETEPTSEQPPEGDTATSDEPGLFDSLELETEQPAGTPTAIDLNAKIEVPGYGEVPVKELVDGYLRQSDYTQKTQDLAEQRRSYEDAVELWNAIQDSPIETIQTLANAAGFDVDPSDVRVPTPFEQKQAGEDIKSIVKETLEEMLENNPVIQTITNKTALDLVNEQFDVLETNYDIELKPKDRETVLQYAAKLGVTDLEFVLQGLMKRAEMITRQRDVAKGASTTRSGGHGTPETSPQKTEVNSFEDAVKAAIGELGAERQFQDILA